MTRQPNRVAEVSRSCTKKKSVWKWICQWAHFSASRRVRDWTTHEAASRLSRNIFTSNLHSQWRRENDNSISTLNSINWVEWFRCQKYITSVQREHFFLPFLWISLNNIRERPKLWLDIWLWNCEISPLQLMDMDLGTTERRNERRKKSNPLSVEHIISNKAEKKVK